VNVLLSLERQTHVGPVTEDRRY